MFEHALFRGFQLHRFRAAGMIAAFEELPDARRSPKLIQPNGCRFRAERI
jgi:hypothetical protein